MFSCLKFGVVHAKPPSVYLMIRVVCHFTVWFLHRASEQLQKCNTDVSVWYRPPSIAPPTKIHTSKGYFIYFPKQNPGGRRSNSASAQSGAPTVATSAHSSRKQHHHWIHFILQRARQEHYGLSTLPTTRRASETDSERIRKRKPRYLTILGVNFSPGLNFTTPQTADTTSAAAVQFACQHRGPLLPSFLHLLLFNARMEEEDCGND